MRPENLEWPLNSDVFADASFRTQLLDLAKKNDGTSEEEAAPKSLLFEFDKESQISELRKALEAPICEFVRRLWCCLPPSSHPVYSQALNGCFDWNSLTKTLQSQAIINLSPSAPRSNTDFQQSMHKTYTDCYRMRGFVGGNWAYAINTNDTSGTVLTDGTGNRQLSEIERKLACYYLGWQSVEVCPAWAISRL